MIVQVVARSSASALKTALPAWATALRTQVRSVAGPGWQVGPQSSGVKLTLRYEDGSRASAQLHLSWSAAAVPAVLAAVQEVEAGVRSGLSLAAAVQRLGLSRPGAPGRGRVDWGGVGVAYGEWLMSNGQVSARTWHRAYAPVVRDLASAGPTTPEEALSAASTGVPGSRGRQVRVGVCARLLKWGVAHHRLPERWMPPASVSQWVGRSAGTAPTPTAPVSDEQILRLLDAAEGDRLWPALATLAGLGLRPHELRHLVWGDDGTARVTAGKTGPRVVLPLPLPGLDMERVVGCRLPRLARTDERVSKELCLQLYRRPWWAGWRLYHLRHSYGDRGHRLGVLPKDMAQLMGHSLQQHLKTYSRFGAAGDTLSRVRKVLNDKQS